MSVHANEGGRAAGVPTFRTPFSSFFHVRCLLVDGTNTDDGIPVSDTERHTASKGKSFEPFFFSSFSLFFFQILLFLHRAKSSGQWKLAPFVVSILICICNTFRQIALRMTRKIFFCN